MKVGWRPGIAQRRIGAVLSAALLIAAGLVFSSAAPAAALDLPPSREGVYVYDLANIWSQEAIDFAQGTIGAIRERTQAEVVVVSWRTGFSSVDTDTADADAALIMDTWGVGRSGVNDGLVVLFDMDTTLQHGQVYLYTGSGFRDLYLSDEEAADVVDNAMLPKAKDGDLDAALLDGLARIDHVTQPGGNPDRAGQATFRLLASGLIVGVSLIVLALFLGTWWKRGRDARMPTIDDSVLLPAPPPELTPALAAVLRKDEVDSESFTSGLVDLGHRGLLTFAQDDGDSHHVNLVLPAAPGDDAAAEDARRRPIGRAEKELLAAIRFKAGNSVLGWKELRQGEGKKLFDAFKSSMGQAAVAAGWFRDNPTKLTGRWTAIGGGVAIGALVVGILFVLDKSDSARLIQPGREYLGLPLVIAGGIGVAIAVLGRILIARTAAGAQTLAMALAYRNTLRYEIKASATIGQAVQRTTSRLPWIMTPDELTVWAVALGLKHEVDELIKDTFKADPQGGGWSPLWYTGTSGFGSAMDVGSMLSSISTTSASSSGSGFSGGSSGGGGGSGGGF